MPEYKNGQTVREAKNSFTVKNYKNFILLIKKLQ